MAESPNLAPEAITPTTFHGWSDLPDELKVEILSYALISDKSIASGEDVMRPTGCYDHDQLLSDTYFPSSAIRAVI
jgi:hypothetical protein